MYEEMSKDTVLRKVRIILKVPEGASIIDHAQDIMNKLSPKISHCLENERGYCKVMQFRCPHDSIIAEYGKITCGRFVPKGGK